MEDRGVKEEDVISALEGSKKHNIPYSRIMSSMCTIPHPIAMKAHRKFLETNLGDEELFPGTAELERKAIRMMGKLVNDPNVCGYITTGGTESNIQAIRTAFAKPSKKVGNLIVPKSAHFSFDKLADLTRIEIKKAPLDDEFKLDIEKVEDMIDEETVALVGIAGTTEHGQIDPIPALGDIAEDHDLFLHVDAAFGGFVIPFLENGTKFGFEVNGVDTITMDPHKMGLATIPAGGLLFRNESYLDELKTSTPYLATSSQYTLVGTRSGASAAATYAVMKHLGKEGYRKIVRGCMDLVDKLVEATRDMGVDTVIPPVMNIVTLNVDGTQVKKRLWEKGWVTSVTREGDLRLVIMPHHSEDLLYEFIEDLRKSL